MTSPQPYTRPREQLLADVLTERFPTHQDVARELCNPVPLPPSPAGSRTPEQEEAQHQAAADHIARKRARWARRYEARVVAARKTLGKDPT